MIKNISSKVIVQGGFESTFDKDVITSLETYSYTEHKIIVANIFLKYRCMNSEIILTYSVSFFALLVRKSMHCTSMMQDKMENSWHTALSYFLC